MSLAVYCFQICLHDFCLPIYCHVISLHCERLPITVLVHEGEAQQLYSLAFSWAKRISFIWQTSKCYAQLWLKEYIFLESDCLEPEQKFHFYLLILFKFCAFSQISELFQLLASLSVLAKLAVIFTIQTCSDNSVK